MTGKRPRKTLEERIGMEINISPDCHLYSCGFMLTPTLVLVLLNYCTITPHEYRLQVQNNYDYWIKEKNTQDPEICDALAKNEQAKYN
jgi:hypothetical protein